MGYCVDFDGLNDYLAINGDVVRNVDNGATTLEGWAIIDSYSEDQAFLFGAEAFGGVDSGMQVRVFNDDWIEYGIKKTNGYNVADRTLYSTTTGIWHYYAVSWDTVLGHDGIVVFDNGITSVMSKDSQAGSQKEFTIGARPCDHTIFEIDGRIDEVRVSNIARSAEWLSTSYNTMNDSSGFFSVGSEESAP